MSKADEIRVCNLLSSGLNLEFEDKKYLLDQWGEVDNWCKLGENCFLFIEVETSQKHPCTNVLKIWPSLESKKTFRIFLIQTFFSYSPGLYSNRGKLSLWTGAQFENLYPNRFRYRRIVFDEISDDKFYKDLKLEINNFIGIDKNELQL